MPGRVVVGSAFATAVIAGAVALGVLLRRDGHAPRPAAVWSVARAESRIETAPPAAWVRRHWDVDYVTCDGLGRAELDGGERLYRRFSCDITVVRPSGDCKSSGVYFCVAGFESTVLTRAVRVIDAVRYALTG